MIGRPMFPKPTTIRDKQYKTWIRQLPCLCCGRPSDPHHVPEKGHGSKGAKTSDRRCIPLCSTHHKETHNSGRETFAAKYGIDYEPIIERLNQIYTLTQEGADAQRCHQRRD